EEGYTPSLVDDEQQDGSSASATEGLSLVKDETQVENPSSPDDDPEPPRPTGRPSLRVVK
ncbi:MAG: stringent starvation protein B, partial [Proteus mirabilis]